MQRITGATISFIAVWVVIGFVIAINVPSKSGCQFVTASSSCAPSTATPVIPTAVRSINAASIVSVEFDTINMVAESHGYFVGWQVVSSPTDYQLYFSVASGGANNVASPLWPVTPEIVRGIDRVTIRLQDLYTAMLWLAKHDLGPYQPPTN